MGSHAYMVEAQMTKLQPTPAKMREETLTGSQAYCKTFHLCLNITPPVK